MQLIGDSASSGSCVTPGAEDSGGRPQNTSGGPIILSVAEPPGTSNIGAGPKVVGRVTSLTSS